MTWKLADEWRPYKRQHYWKRPEYWEESWRLEETCSHSDSSEKPSANADVKKTLMSKIIMTGKEEDEWRQSKLQYCWERPEYWEQSWRLEETCCHTKFSEKPSANADMKSSNEWIIIIIISCTRKTTYKRHIEWENLDVKERETSNILNYT